MALHCRFYESKFPCVDDVVVVQIRQITGVGAFAELVEYNNQEGLIQYQELCDRRIRSVYKLVRVGQLLCCFVIRVDAEKGYIDLSRRRVTPEQKEASQAKFAQAKCVNNILGHAAQLLQLSNNQLEELYNKTAWSFDRDAVNSDLVSCDHVNSDPDAGPRGAYQAFRQIAVRPETLDRCEALTPEERRVVLDCIQTRLGLTEVKIQCTVAVTCFTREGIDAIKEALRAGRALSTHDVPLRIQVVSCPVYSITTTTLHQIEGMEIITKALDKIKESIEASKGKFEIRSAPKMVFHWGSYREEMSLLDGQAQVRGEGIHIGVQDDLTEMSLLDGQAQVRGEGIHIGVQDDLTEMSLLDGQAQVRGEGIHMGVQDDLTEMSLLDGQAQVRGEGIHMGVQDDLTVWSMQKYGSCSQPNQE